MKRFVLLIIPVLICGMALTSCDSDKSDSQLDLRFTGDDIKLFKTWQAYEVPNNGKSHGEIVLNSSLKADELLTRFGLYTTVNFFLDNKPLFDPPIKIYHPVSSMSSNDLQINISMDDKLYLIEFYQLWDWLPAAEREAKLKEQEENSNMRRKQLDVFFKYMNDTGKLVKIEIGEPNVQHPE